MKTLQINRQFLFKISAKHILIVAMLIVFWFALPRLISQIDATAALVDPGMWQLIFLSVFCFLYTTAIAWLILQHYWLKIGLPGIQFMVLQFNNLSTWQQLGFYWASFALLLWAAVGCLTAVI